MPLSRAFKINMPTNAIRKFQLKFVNENLSTSLPVKNGTTSPVILPKDDIHTAITINPTGHVNFLNK